VIIVITALLGVAGALLVKQVFDVGLQPAGGSSVNLPVLIPLVIALMLIPLVNGVLNVTQTYLTNVVGNRVMRDLRERLYEHLQRLLLHNAPDPSGQPITVQGEDAGGFGIVNLTLFSQNFVKNLEFSASVYNVLDSRYGDPASRFHTQDLIGQDGRSFRLKLTYRF